MKKALLQTTANRDIKRGYTDTPDGQIHYWTAGKGEVLLLIHQSTSSVEEYAGLVPYLADQYHLVTFDWPGHGNSDDPSKEYEVDDYTRSALAVLDHLNISECHVLGHHGGALLAMNLAWQYPKRIKRVLLSGTSGLKKEEETKDFVQSLDLKKKHQLELDGKSLSEAWERYVKYLPESNPYEILRPFINHIVSRIRPYDAHFGVLRWNRRPALEAIKDKRILLMQGELDHFVSYQEKLLPLLPNSERTVIKKGGTFLFFEKPKECADAISEFLSKN